MTSFTKTAAVVCAIAAAGLLSACKPKQPPQDAARIIGLRVASTPTTFTASPDSCVLSLLLSNKQQWLDSDKTSTIPESKSMTLLFELLTAPAGENTRATFIVHGFSQSAQPIPNGFQLSVDGKALPSDPLDAGATNFARKFEVNLTPGKSVTPFSVTLALPRPPQDADPYENQQQLDSIDIGLTEAGGPRPCALPPGYDDKKPETK